MLEVDCKREHIYDRLLKQLAPCVASKRDACCPIGGFLGCLQSYRRDQAGGRLGEQAQRRKPSRPVRHPEPLRPQKRREGFVERFANAERLHH
jgi:hypothetical protein